MPPNDQNTTPNPIPTENPIPPNPQEPTEPASENTAHSEPSNIPPEAPEAPGDSFITKSSDIPLHNSIPTEAENKPKPEEKSAPNELNIEPNPEPIPESTQTPKSETAQTPVNEPLASEPEIKSEPLKPEPQTFSQPKISLARELLVKARNAIQFRKRKKLDKIMILFLKQSKITNAEVEKFLHVSDATATRYLSTLEKEGKIKQSGKTGKGVSYSRI